MFELEKNQIWKKINLKNVQIEEMLKLKDVWIQKNDQRKMLN
jgi:hypothetical protein